ncbi:hypothetical protein BGZ47_009198, partial [Haplosporangium gracile]
MILIGYRKPFPPPSTWLLRLGSLNDKNGAFWTILKNLQVILKELTATPGRSTTSSTFNVSSYTPPPLPDSRSNVNATSQYSSIKPADSIALFLQASTIHDPSPTATRPLDSSSVSSILGVVPTSSTATLAMTDADKLRLLFSPPTTNNSLTTPPPLPTMESSIAFVSHTSVTKTTSLGEQQRVALTAAIHDPSFISNVTTRIFQATRKDSQSMAQALHSATDLCNTLQVYAYMATAVFIRAVLEDRPLPPCPPRAPLYRLRPTYNGSLTTLQTIWPTIEWRPSNPDVRSHLLDLIIQDGGFMNSLGVILYTGERRQQSRNKAAAAECLSPSDTATVAYGFFVEAMSALPCQKNKNLPGNLMAPMAMAPVFAAIKKHYKQDE